MIQNKTSVLILTHSSNSCDTHDITIILQVYVEVCTFYLHMIQNWLVHTRSVCNVYKSAIRTFVSSEHSASFQTISILTLLFTSSAHFFNTHTCWSIMDETKDTGEQLQMDDQVRMDDDHNKHHTFLTDLMEYHANSTYAQIYDQQTNVDFDVMQAKIGDFFVNWIDRSSRMKMRFMTPTQSRDDLDLHLNTIDFNQYYTSLARLTSDCNERMIMIKTIDQLTSKMIPFKEIVAINVLKQWQSDKIQRKSQTQKLINQIQYFIDHKDELNDHHSHTDNINSNIDGNTSNTTIFIKCQLAHHQHNKKTQKRTTASGRETNNDFWHTFDMESYGTIHIKTKLPSIKDKKVRLLRIEVKSTIDNELDNMGYVSIFSSNDNNDIINDENNNVINKNNHDTNDRKSNLKFDYFITNNKTNKYKSHSINNNNHNNKNNKNNKRKARKDAKLDKIIGNIKSARQNYHNSENETKQSVLASNENYIWKSDSPITNVKIDINDLDSNFSSTRNYYLSIENKTNVNGKIKLIITCDTTLNRSALRSKSKSKSNKSRLLKSSNNNKNKTNQAKINYNKTSHQIRQELNKKLRQLRNSSDKRIDFETNVIKYKSQRRKKNTTLCDQINNHQNIIKQNFKSAGNLSWNSPRFCSIVQKKTRNSPYKLNNIQTMQIRANICKWSQIEDEKLIQLSHRFDDLKSCRRWLIISQMINHFNQNVENPNPSEQIPIRTPIDCNQRYAILKGFEMFNKQKLLRLNVYNKKSQIEMNENLQTEKKLYNFHLKLNQIEKRKKYLLYQKKLVPIQKRWIIILKYFEKYQLFIQIMSDIKLREKQLKSQINAALIIQKFVRHRLTNKRRIRASIYANYLKTILNICVVNHKINQYNRASNTLRLFFTTYINIYSNDDNHDNSTNNNYNPMCRVVNSFRNTIKVLQRFAKKLDAKKNAQCVIFAKQFVEYINHDDSIKRKLGINLKLNKSKEFTLNINDKLILKVCHHIYIRKQIKYRSHLQSYFKQLHQYNLQIDQQQQKNENQKPSMNRQQSKTSQKSKLLAKPSKPRYSYILKKSDFEAMLIKTEIYAKAVKSARRRGAMPGDL